MRPASCRREQQYQADCRREAEHCYGRKGLWAYEAFDRLNTVLFVGSLPWPLILWGLTAYGRCGAWSRSAGEYATAPVILLHPSLLGGTVKQAPWDIPTRCLGPLLAFDVLLHECLHVHIDANRGGHSIGKAHDCPEWVDEVNRIAPLIGLVDVRAGRTILKREPIPDAPPTPRGKKQTKPVRTTDGNVPYGAVATFPWGIHLHRGTFLEHYSAGQLPLGVPEL